MQLGPLLHNALWNFSGFDNIRCPGGTEAGHCRTTDTSLPSSPHTLPMSLAIPLAVLCSFGYSGSIVRCGVSFGCSSALCDSQCPLCVAVLPCVCRSTLAGAVDNPAKTLPTGMVVATVMIMLNYLIPVMTAVALDP